MSPQLSAAAVTAALAIAGAAPATGDAKATQTGKHRVNVDSTYVYAGPGVGFTGTLFKGETFKVKRLSKSGKLAYGMAYGHVNRHVYIKTAALDRAR